MENKFVEFAGKVKTWVIANPKLSLGIGLFLLGVVIGGLLF